MPVKAEEIDAVIGDFFHLSALLCTDTATLIFHLESNNLLENNR